MRHGSCQGSEIRGFKFKTTVGFYFDPTHICLIEDPELMVLFPSF